MIIIAFILMFIGVLFSFANEKTSLYAAYTFVLLGGMLAIFNIPKQKDQEMIQQVKIKMEQCEKSLPRDQKCIILIEAVPDVNTKG